MAMEIVDLVLRFQRLFPTVDLFNNGTGRSGPDEGLGVGVVVVEVVVDGHLQLDDGVEHAATDALSGDLGKETFDQVEPRRRGRREMQLEPGMAFKPPLDLRRLVGGVVVDDQVESQVLGRRAVDLVQEADEFLMAMLLHALADDRAVEHVQRRE